MKLPSGHVSTSKPVFPRRNDRPLETSAGVRGSCYVPRFIQCLGPFQIIEIWGGKCVQLQAQPHRSLKTAVVPDVVSFLEPAHLDVVHSHRRDECTISRLYQEGGLKAVYIHMGWITVFIYSSVLGLH